MNISRMKVAIVTGATGAIGKAIARNIAKDHTYDVHIIARNVEKASSAVNEIQRQTGNPHVRYHLVDLSSREEIYQLAGKWTLPVHVLINNAAVAPPSRLENEAGIEMQFATNVLGYFFMIDSFAKQLKASAPSRIINVASYWAGGLDMNDPEFKHRPYDNDTAYRQSKQANRMLTKAFAENFKSFKIAVVSCHPGDVNSRLSNDLGFGGHENPDQGALTPVWLATLPFGQLKTGAYYEHQRETYCQFSREGAAVEELYQLCTSYRKF